MISIGIIAASARGYYAMTPTSQPWAFTQPERLIEWALRLGEPCFGVELGGAGERIAKWLHGRGFSVRWMPGAEGKGLERGYSIAHLLAAGAGVAYECQAQAKLLMLAERCRREAEAWQGRAYRYLGLAAMQVRPG